MTPPPPQPPPTATIDRHLRQGICSRRAAAAAGVKRSDRATLEHPRPLQPQLPSTTATINACRVLVRCRQRRRASPTTPRKCPTLCRTARVEPPPTTIITLRRQQATPSNRRRRRRQHTRNRLATILRLRLIVAARPCRHHHRRHHLIIIISILILIRILTIITIISACPSRRATRT